MQSPAMTPGNLPGALGMAVSRILYGILSNSVTVISLPAEAGSIGMRLIPEDADSEESSDRRSFLCCVLHHMGFFVPPHLRSERWALTPPFHPYPTRLFPVWSGGMFSVTLSVVRNFHHELPRILRGMLPCGVRTFLCLPKQLAKQLPSAIDLNLCHVSQ